jgi:DNA-binding transcriptional regulator LsrR (DeoR family)
MSKRQFTQYEQGARQVREAVITLYCRGFDRDQIANQVNVSPRTVSRILKATPVVNTLTGKISGWIRHG